MTSRSLLAGRHRSGGTYCTRLQDGEFLYSEVGSSRFRRSSGSSALDCTVYDLPCTHRSVGSLNPKQLILLGKYSPAKQLWSDDGVAFTLEGHAEVRAVISL